MFSPLKKISKKFQHSPTKQSVTGKQIQDTVHAKHHRHQTLGRVAKWQNSSLFGITSLFYLPFCPEEYPKTYSNTFVLDVKAGNVGVGTEKRNLDLRNTGRLFVETMQMVYLCQVIKQD